MFPGRVAQFSADAAQYSSQAHAAAPSARNPYVQLAATYTAPYANVKMKEIPFYDSHAELLQPTSLFAQGSSRYEVQYQLEVVLIYHCLFVPGGIGLHSFAADKNRLNILMEELDQLTMDSVREFVKWILSNIRVEALVYGNNTEESVRNLYDDIVDKLKTKCNTRPLRPAQLVKEREMMLKPGHCQFNMTNQVHKSSCIENYYNCNVQDAPGNMLLEFFSQTSTMI